MVVAVTTVSIVIALTLTAAFAVLVFNGVEPTLDLVRHHGQSVTLPVSQAGRR